jgi:Cytochrome D1 heme domain
MRFALRLARGAASRRRILQQAAALAYAAPLLAAAQTMPTLEPRAADPREQFRLDAEGRLWRHDTNQAAARGQPISDGPSRLLAVSRDGQVLLLARDSPSQLQLLDRDGRLLQQHAVQSRDGSRPARVAALADAAARRSFIIALQDLPELWEISYDPRAEEIYEGLVHDFRMGEGVPIRGYLGVRRIKLPQPLAEVIADPIGMHALGVAAGSGAAPGTAEVLHVVNLDVRREVARITVPVTRPLQGHAVFDDRQQLLLAQPQPRGTRLLQVDLDQRTWRLAAEWPVSTSAWHGHTGARHLWATVPASAGKPGHVLAVDKRTLQVVGELALPAADVSVLSLTRDGRQVLLRSARAVGGAGEGEGVTLVDEALREWRGSFRLGR